MINDTDSPDLLPVLFVWIFKDRKDNTIMINGRNKAIMT